MKGLNTSQEIENIITIIGCNRKEFLNIISKAENKITMSASDNHYTTFWIFDGSRTIAKYDHKGDLTYYRNETGELQATAKEIDNKIDLIKGEMLNKLSNKDFYGLNDLQYEIDKLEWLKEKGGPAA